MENVQWVHLSFFLTQQTKNFYEQNEEEDA